MNWQNSGYNLGDATLGATQDRPVLQSFVSLYQRARRARLGLGSHNQTPHTLPWTTAREAQIPPPSVARGSPCPAPTLLGTLTGPVKPVTSIPIL